MKKFLLPTLLIFLLTGCKSSRIGSTENVEVRFLDDYIIPKDIRIDGTLVGGLSGISYQDGKFFLVSDDPGDPRIYTAKINISQEQIDSVSFEEVTHINSSHDSLDNVHLDLESLLYDAEKDQFILSSEGSINSGKDPMILSLSRDGNFLNAYKLPKYFGAESEEGPRHNGMFEGLGWSLDRNGFWMAMELPLKTDGPKPKLVRTKSPVRITYFDKGSRKPVSQFTYLLEPIAKIPWMYFAVNGVTDLLQYAPDKFLILERGYASGHGTQGNTIRIFDVDTDLATNTLRRDHLKVIFYNPAEKELLYDFKWAKKYLSKAIIDNIEGICFGPILSNGNRSLLLVSDNNFNSLGEQINQVILMEIKIN